MDASEEAALQEKQLEQALAARLTQERERLDVKPEDLAEMAGVHRTSMFMYLKGARVPDALVLAKLLARGVDVLYVLSGRRELRNKEDLGERTRDLLDRYNALPSDELRKFIDDALLLAYLASNDRRAYHEGDFATPSISINRSKVGQMAARDMHVVMPPKKPKR